MPPRPGGYRRRVRVDSTMNHSPLSTGSAITAAPLPGAGERRVRDVVVILLVVFTVVASFWLTDDSWPFAPFHMFATTTQQNGVVRKLAFRVDTVDGRQLALDASAFHLRRAEAEGLVSMALLDGRPTRCLSHQQLAAMAARFNREHHGGNRITQLDQIWLIRHLRHGRVVAKAQRIGQTWPAPNTAKCLR